MSEMQLGASRGAQPPGLQCVVLTAVIFITQAAADLRGSLLSPGNLHALETQVIFASGFGGGNRSKM